MHTSSALGPRGSFPSTGREPHVASRPASSADTAGESGPLTLPSHGDGAAPPTLQGGCTPLRCQASRQPSPAAYFHAFRLRVGPFKVGLLREPPPPGPGSGPPPGLGAGQSYGRVLILVSTWHRPGRRTVPHSACTQAPGGGMGGAGKLTSRHEVGLRQGWGRSCPVGSRHRWHTARGG